MYTLEVKNVFGESVLYYENLTSSPEVQVINDEVAEENMVPVDKRTAKALIEWLKVARPNWTVIENGAYILGEREHKKEKSYGPKF